MSVPAPEGGGRKSQTATDLLSAATPDHDTESRISRPIAGPAGKQAGGLPTQARPETAAGLSGLPAELEQVSNWHQLVQLASSQGWTTEGPEQIPWSKRFDAEVTRLSATDSSPPSGVASQILAALARLRPQEPLQCTSLDFLLAAILRDLPNLLLEELTSALEALAELRYHPGPALEDFTRQAVKRQEGAAWRLEDASRLCFADESLGGSYAVKYLLPIITAQQRSSNIAWKLKDLGRMLWALASGGMLSDEILTMLGVASFEAEDAQSETLQQIAVAWLAGPNLQLHLPQALLLQAQQAHMQMLKDAATPEGSEEVASALSCMGMSCVQGILLEANAIKLDIAIPISRTAIFLDGPQAFCANDRSALGSTKLKWRIAAERGWTAVSLRLQEWQACQDLRERLLHLTQLLNYPLETRSPYLAAERSQQSSAPLPPLLLHGEALEHGFPGAEAAAQHRLAKQPMHLPTIRDSVFEKAAGDQGWPNLPRGTPSHMSSFSEASFSASSQDAAPTMYGWRGNPGLQAQLGGLHAPYQGSHIAYLQQKEATSRLGEMGFSMPPNPLDPAAFKELRSSASADPRLRGGVSGLLPGMGMDFLGSADPTRAAPMAGFRPLGPPLPQEQQAPLQHRPVASISALKREVEHLNLDPHAPQHIQPLLSHLDAQQFASLLSELARDNAFRAWQIFDWVRSLPGDHELISLCDVNTYVTMISLCGIWQQPDRALALADDLLGRGIKCGIEVYGPLHSTMVKCARGDVAWKIYELAGQEGMARDKAMFHTMVDVLVKMNRPSDALKVLDDMKKANQPAEVQLFNLVVLSCTKMNNPRAVLDVYKRMAEDGVQPNTKTFTALIGSVGKMNTVSQTMNIIEELLAHDLDSTNLTQTYSALMSACEKAGQCELAVALFERMSSQGCKPDVSIFNSMIAACAHGGEYHQARLMFERMPEHECVPDAVTYANLIRAYKKGGQWCHALNTFEAMQSSGCKPHAAVFSSIIDVLWQTGSAWAQAKALRLFNSAVESGSLAGAAESCKKGTLKVDLQALTVGVAVLSMAAWLKQARQAVLQDQAGPLSSSRKLAVVNGLGEHSRAQGHSAAVKEAVGAGLLGCKAPFRLVQDHSRSGRLEASTLALQKWLISSAFEAYLKLLQGSPEMLHQELMPTSEYMRKELDESAKCADLFKKIKNYESMYPLPLKVMHRQSGYLAMHKQLVAVTLQYRDALGVTQETAHTALALMDRCMLVNITPSDPTDILLICACLRIAAVQESSPVPPPLVIQALTNIPAVALERMEATIRTALNSDTECISAVHCLKIYLQRLGVDLRDDSAVRCASGCAFTLSTSALSEMPTLQHPPSLTAAALLVAARKAQGSVPFWPSVLSQMTAYTESGSPPFAAAIGAAERLCTKLYSMQESALRLGGLV